MSYGAGAPKRMSQLKMCWMSLNHHKMCWMDCATQRGKILAEGALSVVIQLTR